jgi:hypothetical protein
LKGAREVSVEKSCSGRSDRISRNLTLRPHRIHQNHSLPDSETGAVFFLDREAKRYPETESEKVDEQATDSEKRSKPCMKIRKWIYWW